MRERSYYKVLTTTLKKNLQSEQYLKLITQLLSKLFSYLVFFTGEMWRRLCIIIFLFSMNTMLESGFPIKST